PHSAPRRSAAQTGRASGGTRVLRFDWTPGTAHAILYRIPDAKKPETRIRGIEKFVVMIEGKMFY
ncbi:MAG: YdeI/OmpD-associated family protein, partial [Longimicrobiales bacterium]